MSYFDSIRFQFGNVPVEQKLAVLRSESIRMLTTISGYGNLIRHAVEQQETSEPSEDLTKWCAEVVDSARAMRDLIDALTAPQRREGCGLPELRPYDSLLDAVRQTAHKLTLPIAEAIDDTSKVFLHSQYPLVLLDEPRYQREVMFSLVESDYSVQLLSWTDQRMFRVEYEVSPSSLDEAVTIISHWLTEYWTTDEIKQACRRPSGG